MGRAEKQMKTEGRKEGRQENPIKSQGPLRALQPREWNDCLFLGQVPPCFPHPWMASLRGARKTPGRETTECWSRKDPRGHPSRGGTLGFISKVGAGEAVLKRIQRLNPLGWATTQEEKQKKWQQMKHMVALSWSLTWSPFIRQMTGLRPRKETRVRGTQVASSQAKSGLGPLESSSGRLSRECPFPQRPSIPGTHSTPSAQSWQLLGPQESGQPHAVPLSPSPAAPSAPLWKSGPQ